ncbi:gluconate 2-dehydrogenase subunit 3 family protein [Acidisoma silvae]|uniref:Gluconate 2-dehydrogenase subunit 3 family protein n=1 Tax=Acidisoma silvae TaxID=2802396 RepID=A0A964DXU8_9PROT|nr:gluconate 2-dehydrogenase subunit 3 family protein [Acidisoma silvae]MCB8874098.1 gluconate 2-dehydrogenase subunit 3 family protein [Acidisoma silvae]
MTLAGTALAGLAQAADGGPSGYAPSFFTADEFAFVTAFVDRLIPADEEGPGAVELDVPNFIDLQMNTTYGHGGLWYMHPPFRQAPATFGNQLGLPPREIYRQGIAAAETAIQAKYGKRFTDMTAGERDTVITAMQKKALAMAPVPASMLFGQFLTNTKEGYFSDPIHGGNRGMAAWKMIGYPGARADFTDWVDRYGAKYPFGPVSITDLGA